MEHPNIRMGLRYFLEILVYCTNRFLSSAEYQFLGIVEDSSMCSKSYLAQKSFSKIRYMIIIIMIMHYAIIVMKYSP